MCYTTIRLCQSIIWINIPKLFCPLFICMYDTTLKFFATFKKCFNNISLALSLMAYVTHMHFTFYKLSPRWQKIIKKNVSTPHGQYNQSSGILKLLGEWNDIRARVIISFKLHHPKKLHSKYISHLKHTLVLFLVFS